jgi:intein/homing endonuclease
MSDKASSAGNQQGSLRDPSETTRQAPARDEIIAYLQGALHDATFNSNKRYRFSQKGTGWLKVLQKLLSKIGHKSWIYQEGRTRSVFVLETLAKFLDFKFDPMKLNSAEEKSGYIRGFFDAEGSIPRQKGRFYIQLAQKDKIKIVKLKKILQNLGIKTGKIHNPSGKVDPDYWRIYVLAEGHQKFLQEIGSWHPRKEKIIKSRLKI